MILLLGIAFTGMGIILAHSQTEYAGIGQVGIHGVKNTRSLHVPGEIYFNSNNNNFSNYMILIHNETEQRVIEFPDNSGMVLTMISDSPRPSCTDLRNGQMYWDGTDVSICAGEEWWRLHTIHEP